MCSGLQKTHLFCTGLRFGRSRSFRVIQGRWFWYQSKARIRLPISRSLWLWSYLAPFSRYVDLLAKNCLFLLNFPYPSLIRRPRSLCSLWNFAVMLSVLETRIMGLSSSEDRMIVAGVVLAWYQCVTDRRSDRRSDGQTESIIANTALCIARAMLTRCNKMSSFTLSVCTVIVPDGVGRTDGLTAQ